LNTGVFLLSFSSISDALMNFYVKREISYDS